jgi:hypothetical protein
MGIDHRLGVRRGGVAHEQNARDRYGSNRAGDPTIRFACTEHATSWGNGNAYRKPSIFNRLTKSLITELSRRLQKRVPAGRKKRILKTPRRQT